MPQTPTIIGQNLPDANVETILFTLGTGEQAQFSIFVCNQSSVMDYITISLVRDVPSPVQSSYTHIAYATPIIGTGVLAFSGLFMNEGDSVKVTSLNGSSSFNATGMIYT